MALELLESGSFMREQIKTRMLKRAAELWGYADSEIDSFDPLVTLLIDACAVELEKISAEINQVQSKLLDRLAQLMNPEIDVAKPAFGVLQVQSIEPKGIIFPETPFVFRRQNRERMDSTVSGEIYFSPVRKLPIFDAKVVYIATLDTLYSVENGNQKFPIAEAEQKIISPNQKLWIGMEVNDSISSLKDFYFYFDLQNPQDREVFYQQLHFSHFFSNGKELTKRVGLPNKSLDETILPSFEAELNIVKKVEKEVELFFENRYFTICDTEETITTAYFPEELAQIFAQKPLKTIKNPLVWVEIQFSHAIPAKMLSGLICQVNCIPVINRKINKFTYKLQQNFNIIPLESVDVFWGMKEIRNSNSIVLKSIPLGNLLELDIQTYTIQYGINRFDGRNAREMLTNMLETVRDESASFSALGEDFLSSMIRELNQTIARLEVKVDAEEMHKNPVPYLVIKQNQQGENVFVEYWTNNGEQGNKIPMGSKLSVNADASLQKDNIYMITTTQGGKDKLKVSEKISHYKKALLSRNRIVTIEDVRALCMKELGESVQEIAIKKGFQASTAPNMGFLRCIDILIKPAKSTEYNKSEWQQRIEQLRNTLESQSVGNIPFQVMVNP